MNSHEAIPVSSRRVKSLMGYCLLLVLMVGPVWGAGGIADTTDGSHREPTIANIDIEVLDGTDRVSEWIQVAQDVISLYLAQGDPFSAARIEESLAALKACGFFTRIHADSREDAHGVTLIYTLTPFKLIKEIIIKGNYPLFENKVLNAMTVYPGDAYVQAVADAQADIVADLFRKEGYIAPDVVVGAWEDPGDKQYILFVTIDKGPYFSLGRIEFKGNRGFDSDVLKWRLSSWRRAMFGRAAGRFKQAAFKKDIDNVVKFYRKRQYFDVRVTHTLKKNPETGWVEVAIAVDEGARYNIMFEGNLSYGNRALRKQLALEDIGNRGGLGLRKSVRNIRGFYRQRGYPQCRIETQKEDVQTEGIVQRNIRLVIDEGPHVIVNRLDIVGNTVYADRKLKRQILTRGPGFLHDGAFVEEVLQEDVLVIQNLYDKKGYRQSKISVDKTVTPVDRYRHHMEIDLGIEEGVQTMVSAVEFEGLAAVSPESLRKQIKLKPDKPFVMYVLNNDERRVAEIISEKGHPYVKVESHTAFNDDKSRVHVVFKVDEGPLIKMGNTYYNGNFRTKKSILDREIEMQPGDAFSLKKMYAGQQNIRAMNIFRSVRFNPVGLKDGKEEIHLFAETDEKPPYYFQANIGYESVKGFYAGSKFGDHNLWGLNKDAWIGGEVSQTGYWVESRLFEPRFWGTRISSDLGVFLEWEEPFNQTFTTRTYGTDLYFSRKLTNRFTGNLGFKLERRQQFLHGEDTAEEDTFELPRSIFTASPSIGYDSRDNFIRPREGIFSFFGVDLSRGIENSFDDFYKYRFELRGFTTPVKRLTLAGRASFGDIHPYGSAGVVPQDQLFFLGGTASVRGFDQNLFLYDSEGNPVGGEMAAVGSVEARVDLGRNFEFSLFYDVGYLNQTSGLEVTDNVRDSVGAGLRYVTPIGAIGLLYGHKLDPGSGESPGRFHFSVGYTF